MKMQHSKTLQSSQVHPDMFPSGRVSLESDFSSQCSERSQNPWTMSTWCKPVPPRLCGSEDRHTTAPFPFLSCSSKHVLFHATSTAQITMQITMAMMIMDDDDKDAWSAMQGIRNLLSSLLPPKWDSQQCIPRERRYDETWKIRHLKAKERDLH